jgi:alkylation response protein AidB-like acyl-CoA dehydrogenase
VAPFFHALKETPMTYRAPVKDMLFVMKELAEHRCRGPDAWPFEDAGYDTAQAVLEECAKLNEGVVAPLNWDGDLNPSSFSDGQVHATPGLQGRLPQYAAGGWQGLQHPVDCGGQGLPKLIHAACMEMVNAPTSALRCARC